MEDTHESDSRAKQHARVAPAHHAFILDDGSFGLKVRPATAVVAGGTFSVRNLSSYDVTLDFSSTRTGLLAPGQAAQVPISNGRNQGHVSDATVRLDDRANGAYAYEVIWTAGSIRCKARAESDPTLIVDP